MEPNVKRSETAIWNRAKFSEEISVERIALKAFMEK